MVGPTPLPSPPEGTAPAGKPAPAPVPPAAPVTITIDDFKKVTLKIGKVVESAIHPNADKLLVLKVDLGGETRQIVSGIRQWYAPEQMTGKTVVIVANLQPAKLRGVESQGMLLAASSGGEVIVCTTDKEALPGSKVT